ncbi:MAG: MdtA/MuxA family multidrug efflux RND transporter periplasmic adaptor subunit, partial [Caulobacteraceae bacterium]|nr:MdtA/MuxA family multidrug efflux RND transporter periplasmic adaptor subunit [Caulobacteraceae bacterium]
MSEPHSGPNPPGLSPYRAPTPRKRPAWRTFLWIVLAVAAAFFVAFLLTPHDGTGAGKGPGRGPGGPGGPPGMGGPPGGGGPGGGGRRGATVVGVATAQKGDIDIQLTALGTVTPPATVTVRARIAGVLTKVLYKEGQTVKAGQLLAQVDGRPYVIALQQDEGQLLKDQAVLANARLDLERYRTLAAQDSVAKQTLDAQISTVKQAEGTVKTDQAAVASAKLNIEYCHVTAPISGRVGLRQVDVGNYVTTGDTNGVVVINQIDPIDVVFTLPEDNVPQIQARVAKGAVLKAVALDRAGVATLAQGSLSTLDNQIDTTTGTVKAKARFDNASAALYPNQFVNIRLLVDTAKDVVVVPTQAVRHGSQGDFVYTVDLDQNAKMVLVKVGPVDGERSAILSGVQVGDMVITDGGDRLRDGGHVILPGQAEETPKAKPASKGFFAWLSGLFGKKDKATGAASGAPGSTASGEAP